MLNGFGPLVWYSWATASLWICEAAAIECSSRMRGGSESHDICLHSWRSEADSSMAEKCWTDGDCLAILRLLLELRTCLLLLLVWRRYYDDDCCWGRISRLECCCSFFWLFSKPRSFTLAVLDMVALQGKFRSPWLEMFCLGPIC